MSSLPKNTKNILAGIAPVLLFTSAILIAACGDGNESSHAASGSLGQATVRLELNSQEIPLFDSLVVDCYGPDTLHLVSDSETSSLEISLFPDDSWIFHASVYANGGMLVEEGEVTGSVKAGEAINLSLNLHAVLGYLYVQISLGLGNPLHIQSGSLQISGTDFSESDTLEVDSVYGVFSSGALTLNQTYLIEISLQDSLGDTLYVFSDSITFSTDNPFPTLQLTSLKGSVLLQIVSETLSPVLLEGALSSGRKQAPQKGDILITEFLANPRSSGDAFEFVEIYNGTLDTLTLDSCTFSKSSATTGTLLDSTVVLPPTAFLVLGNDSMTLADVHTKLSLTNESGSVVLHCQGILIDSLYYYTKADTSGHDDPFPITVGKSAQLPLNNWNSRELGSAWCLGSEAFTIGEDTFYGSPGMNADCP